jgi:TetR/AcrR family transcriptional regulator, cholesterol catabolism regulator
LTASGAEGSASEGSSPPRRGNQYERILASAVELFQAKGFHATSVREIGERAGVTQSSLYYHTRSKPQILIDLNQRFMDRLTPAVASIVDQDASADVKLRMIVQELLTIIAQHQGEVVSVLHERRSLPPDAAAKIQEQRDGIDAMIDQVIHQGIDEGLFREVNVPLARLALSGMVNWAYEWYRPDGALAPEAIAAFFSSLFVDGISSAAFREKHEPVG